MDESELKAVVESHYHSIELEIGKKTKKLFGLTLQSKFVLISLQIQKTNFPKEILNMLEAAFDRFKAELTDIPKNQTQNLKALCEEFCIYLENLVIGIGLTPEDIHRIVLQHFMSLHSLSDSVSGDELQVLMNTLKQVCEMPQEVTYMLFRTKNLQQADSNFYERVLMKEIKNSQMLKEIFYDVYSDFIKNSVDVSQEFNFYDKRVKFKKLKIYKEGLEKMVAEIKEIMFVNRFCWIVLKRFCIDEELGYINMKMETSFYPYEAIFANLLEYQINQVVEVEPGICVLVSSKGSGITLAMFVADGKTKVKSLFHSEYVKIASGSTKKMLVVVQNSPTRLWKMKIKKKKLVDMENIKLKLENYEFICEIAYIPHTDKIVISTNQAGYYIISGGSECIKIDSNAVCSLKYINPVSLLAVIFSDSLKLFNENLECIKNFQFEHLSEILGQSDKMCCVDSVQITFVNNLIYISNVIENFILYFKLKLSESDLERMKFESSFLLDVKGYAKNIKDMVSLAVSDMIGKERLFEQFIYNYSFGLYLESRLIRKKTLTNLEINLEMLEEPYK